MVRTNCARGSNGKGQRYNFPIHLLRLEGFVLAAKIVYDMFCNYNLSILWKLSIILSADLALLRETAEAPVGFYSGKIASWK